MDDRNQIITIPLVLIVASHGHIKVIHAQQRISSVIRAANTIIIKVGHSSKPTQELLKPLRRYPRQLNQLEETFQLFSTDYNRIVASGTRDNGHSNRIYICCLHDG